MESAAHREDADNGGFVGSVSVDLSSSAEGAKGAILHDHAPLLAERSGNGRQVEATATAAGGLGERSALAVGENADGSLTPYVMRSY
jgi:hypothetical protein